MERAILGNGLLARPLTADEGQVFIDLTTDIDYVFTDGQWVDKNATLATPAPVECEACKIDLDDPMPGQISIDEVIPDTPPTPKKTTTSKRKKKEV